MFRSENNSKTTMVFCGHQTSRKTLRNSVLKFKFRFSLNFDLFYNLIDDSISYHNYKLRAF
jgi:hypothetical protein